MNDDIVEVRAVDRSTLDGLKAWGWVSYVLHLIVAVSAVLFGVFAFAIVPVLLIISLIIDLVKRADSSVTWHQSHFSWRIKSVIWAAIWYVVTSIGFVLSAPFWIFGVAFNPLWLAVSIWFLYRIVRGMIAMNKQQALST